MHHKHTLLEYQQVIMCKNALRMCCNWLKVHDWSRSGETFAFALHFVSAVHEREIPTQHPKTRHEIYNSKLLTVCTIIFNPILRNTTTYVFV